MFVEPELLRMGADFSMSAGEIVRRGADEFASTSIPAGIFGDFDAANDFHTALGRAHEVHTATMHSHHASFDGFATKVNIGAAAFVNQDEAAEASVRVVGDNID